MERAHGSDGDPGAVQDQGQVILRSAIDGLAAHVAVVDKDGWIVQVNRAWERFGHQNARFTRGLGVGANYLDVCDRAGDAHPAAEVAARLRGQLAGDTAPWSVEYPCHGGGVERWFRLVSTPCDAGDARAVLTHENITDRHRAEQDLHIRSRLLRELATPVVAMRPDGVVGEWNPAAERVFGYPAEGMRGGRWVEMLTVPSGGLSLLDHLDAVGHVSTEREVVRPDGSTVHVALYGIRVDDDAAQPLGIVVIAFDLTARVDAERQLRGVRDFLRAVARDMGEGLLTHDPAGRVTFVNRAAARMLGCEEGDQVTRIMGEAAYQAEHLRKHETSFTRRDGTTLDVEFTSSPFVTEAGVSGQVVVFSDISERKERERDLLARVEWAALIGTVRDALDEGRMVLHAQPIIDVRSGETVQHELLIRMIGGDGELIAPGAFLPAAESFGLIREVDRWVITQAVGLAARGLPVELNLSASSLSDPGLLDTISAEIAVRRVDPALLVFELTETGILEDERSAGQFIAGVREMGAKVALDDFGTGYSGFSYLKHLPVSYLKIDIDFVRDLLANDASRHVVAAVVDLSDRFGLRTIAEGVEDLDTLELLGDLGVDLAQGMVIGAPVPLGEAFGPDQLPRA